MAPSQTAERRAAELVAAALAWLLGLVLLHQCERLPTPPEWAALLAVAVLAALAAWHWPAWRWATLALFVSLLAFGQGGLRAQARLAQQLPQAWEARDLVLSGRVDSLPIAVQGQGGVPGWRFEFAVESVNEGQVPDRLMLLAYAAPGGEAPRLLAGERWRWTARLKRPHGLSNPNGFDAELWLFEQGLRATGTVRPGSAQKLSEAPWWVIDAWRQRLRERLHEQVPDAAMAGVLAALSLGDQAAIAKPDWNLFRDTGVAHLLSVSGVHVTLLAWLAMRLVDPMWRRSRRLSLACAAPLAARWIGVVVAFGFALFSGWGVPAQRTVWMLASVALLQTVGLRWPWPFVLLAAAVLVTAIDPWALMQAGFWLSFAAVGLLMAGGEPPPRGWRQHLAVGLRSQAVATLGLAPLSLVCFAQLSLVGVLANLVAIPLVSFLITPLALLGGLLPPLWALAASLSHGLMSYLQWLAAWPDAVWWAPAAPLWAQALALLGALLMALSLPWRLRGAGLLMMLPLLWPTVPRPPAGEFELLAADIGQGNAVLLRTAGHSLLFDAGPAFAPGSDAGERVLLPLLRSLGERRLDLMVLSHRDGDHVGGAASLIRGLPVARLASSIEPTHPLRALLPESTRCEAGLHWEWDGVHFEILHPAPALYEQGLKANDLSCVLRARAASGRRALLAGDLEASQERRLVAAGIDLQSEVLLVPHHGSKTSSSAEWLAAVRPELGLVQAGYRSRFGHPAPTVLARYQAAGIAVVATPACGAWAWRSDASPGEGLCERLRRPRYWQDRPPLAAAEMGPLPEAEGPDMEWTAPF